MDIKKLCYILEIARQQNLSKAAKNLGVSQPALSKYLTRLEEELGTPLFLSRNRQLIPTPAGCIYLEAAKKAVQIRNTTWQQIAALNQKQKQPLLIGVSGFSGSAKIGKLIPELYRKFPNVSIQLTEGDSRTLLTLLKQGTISLAITGIADDSEWPETFYQFSEEELLVCVPAFYRITAVSAQTLSGLPMASVKQFSDIPFLFPAEGSSHFSALQKLMKTSVFSPTVLYQTSNFFVTQNLAQEGMGATFLISRLAMQLDAKKCRIYALQEHPTIQFGIAVRSSDKLTQAEKYLIHRLIQEEQDSLTPYFVMNETAHKFMNTWEES